MKLDPNKSSMIAGDAVKLIGSDNTGTTTTIYPEISFDNASSGEIFNFVQQFITTSKWDSRMKDEIPTLSLFRNHMFYETNTNSNENINAEITNSNNEINEKYFKNSEFDLFKMLNDSIKFYTNNNKTNVSSYLYSWYNNKNNNENEESSFKEDYLFRKNQRKFSENHFAISSYNLIGHEISVSEEIPNTVSTNDVESENNKIVTILPSNLSINENQKKNLNFFEKQFNPILNDVNAKNRRTYPRHYEFLVTQLIKEISYSYQGKIYIKYNNDIEIGDSITLLDHVSSTYGIFEIDAVEHVFDERGLITILFVKAKLDHIDPFLDMYSIKIGYQLMSDFQEKIILDNNTETTLNIKLKNIFGNYLKTLLQTPKYFTPRYLEGKFNGYEAFEPSEVIYFQNSIFNPIRFFPMLKKGKIIYPSTLEYALFNSIDNNYESLFAKFLIYIMQNIRIGFYKAINWAKSVAIFLLDFTAGTITWNISDFLKPYFGFSESKVFNKITKELINTSNKDINIMSEYNPYNGIYNVGNFDLTIGFFNIQAQEISNLFPTNANYTSEQVVKNLTIKENTIKKIISQTFDISLMVELYDTYKGNKIPNADSSSDIYNTDLNSFINNILPDNNNYYEKIELMKNKISSGISTEYGLITSNSKYKIIFNKEIMLLNGRKAIETNIDISSFNIENIETLQVIWFHNIYGDKNLVEKNVYEERKENVKLLIKKYSENINQYNAVVIMADFNLNIFNYGELPTESTSAYLNATMELPNNCEFKSMNNKATTVNKYGEIVGNPYDNILCSKNLTKYIKASRFVYPIDEIENRRIVSDHIPIFLGLKKIKY